MPSFSFLHSKVPYTFMGFQEAYAKAKVVYLPAPYDSTTSYRTGAREGPHAILTASRQVEAYDEELKADFSTLGFYTAEELQPDHRGPKETVERVSEVVGQVLNDGKFPFLLGGEHSLTSGAIKAFKPKRRNLTVLQFDAHPDLRPEYEGTPYSHASVMSRALDVGCDIVQAGIRAVSPEDVQAWKKYGKRVKTFFAREKGEWTAEEVAEACGEEVYLSFDLDALDSGIMPSTGTPEPGGLQWDETLRILREVCRKRKVVGMDLMELSPIPGLVAPDFLAAKLAYKMTGYAFLKK